MPVFKRSPRLNDAFVKQESSDGGEFWQRVDNALEDGARVWLHSPLLKSLNRSLGHKLEHNQYLMIEPRSSSNSHWSFRARDIILSALALGIVSPLLWLVAMLIKISSPGPVFYKTPVVGQGKRQFIWRKFRSMRVMPEAINMEWHRDQFQLFVKTPLRSNCINKPAKIIDEKRITQVGRIIRKYSIDELPQLANVLFGHMSLVGPRPCLPHEAEFYTGWRSRRFSVAPGLTGIWQVFGRGRVEFDQAAAMDTFYIYRRSFTFDLHLMLKTIAVVISGKGAR